jgi:DNA-binding NarL/FixJ family response regulator
MIDSRIRRPRRASSSARDTVKPHLSQIYAKLDVANRTELATLAASRT